MPGVKGGGRMRFGAVILAGGRSSRMQRDKAFLPCRGTTLLARQVALVRELAPAEILISGRADADYGALDLPVLMDRFTDLGPLAGVERALTESHNPLLLVLAVDLPDMTADFLRRLAARCRADSGVVPRTTRGLEPLAAFYPTSMQPIAAAMLSEERAAMTEFIRHGVEAGLLQEYASPPADEACFHNWNGPGDASPGAGPGTD
jgi:molybdopterin-guanine dinucleotide biosynthesis protein A